MRAGWLLLGAVALGSISTASSADPTSDAFAQGSTMGNGTIQSTFSGINTTTAQTNIPGYGGSTSTQSGYFAGGNGNIEAPGSAQITGCANAAPSSDPMANQYCNAVNFLATNPSVRPQISISSNDPLLVKSRAISNNSSSILQANGINTTGSSSQCVPVTTTTPAQYTTEMCDTVQGASLTQCVLGRVVNFSDDTNYQCNQTIDAYQTQSCDRTATVTIPAAIPAVQNASCTTGTVVGTSCVQPTLPASVNYQCSSNSTLTPQDTCQPASTTATLSYSCSIGTVTGNQCVLPSYSATLNYSCAAGAVLNGTVCYPQPTPPNITTSCPNGASQSGSSCVYPSYAATITYSCPSSQQLMCLQYVGGGQGTNGYVSVPCTSSNQMCQGAATQGASQPATGTTIRTQNNPYWVTPGDGAGLYCSNDQVGTIYSRGGFQCEYNSVSGGGMTGSSTCSGSSAPPVPGTNPEQLYSPLQQARCIAGHWIGIGRYARYYCSQYSRPSFVPCSYGSNTTYSCPSGYTLSGTSCYPPNITPPPTSATPTPSCPQGGTLNGTTCQQASVPLTTNTSCPPGTTLNAGQCVAPSYSAIATLSCPSGGTLNGNICVPPSTSATASYSCPTGSALNGTSCYPAPTVPTTVYTCLAGDTLSGTNCQPPSVPATITYSCGPGTTLSGNTCILAPVITWQDGCSALEARAQ